MAKTAQELQAEADAAKAREEEKKRSSSNWLSNLIPKFSFFNILLFIGIACGAYFLGRTEQGKELLAGIFGKDNVDGFFAKGDGVLAGLASQLHIPIDVSKTLENMPIDQVRTTLAGQKIPPPIIDILAKDESTFRSFLATIKKANGGKIGFNDFINDKTITALIIEHPDLVRKLAAQASALAKSNAPDNKMLVAFNNALLAIAKSDQLDLLLSPANRANTLSIVHTALLANAGISEKTLNALISHNLTADGKVRPQLRNLLVAATDGSLTKLHASLTDTLGVFAPTKTVDVLLNAESRALIRSIGTDNIALVTSQISPALNQRTFEAALAFGDAIDGNVANNGANRPRTLAVMHALAAVATGTAPATAFRGITAAQLSGFFAVPGNQAAVGKLLSVVQPSIAVHWGNNDHGLAEVLASTPDADKILRFMRGDIGWLENAGSTVADWIGVSMTTKLSWAGGKLAENAADVAAVLTPPPATPRAPQQRG